MSIQQGGETNNVVEPDNTVISPNNLTTTTTTSTTQQQQQQHPHFISALEKHAADMTGDEWDLMASELNWTTTQVKLYGLKYMYELAKDLHGWKPPCDEYSLVRKEEEQGQQQQQEEEGLQEEEEEEDQDDVGNHTDSTTETNEHVKAPNNNNNSNNNNNKNNNTDTKDDKPTEEDVQQNQPQHQHCPPPQPTQQNQIHETVWNLDEMILFDNLLVKYPEPKQGHGRQPPPPPNNCHDSTSRWDKIASMLPNKSAIDCKKRFQEYILDKEAKRCRRETFPQLSVASKTS